MTDMALLKEKIINKGTNISKVAEAANMDKSTFYRKMSSNGETFTVKEAYNIAQYLELSVKEINAIFFGIKVA